MDRVETLEKALQACMEELRSAYRRLYQNDGYAENASEAIRAGKEALKGN